ncbi:MAG TPA: hypothetical protein VGJ84_13270, partial [Polyangiaceae bacterium]
GGAALLMACQTTNSSDLKTSGIDAEMSVTATSQTASKVEVTMYPGGDNDPFNTVKLSGGDQLFATAGGVKKQLVGGPTYSNTFEVGAKDAEFVVSLDRTSDTDAPNSKGTLPAPFDLGALSKTSFLRTEPVTITWSPSGTADTMYMVVQGDCIMGGTSISITGDPGTATLPANKLQPVDSQMPGTCTAKVTLKRGRPGVADPALVRDSSMTLYQLREQSFTTTP